jgi:catechol 2,3-dioxygenase-like lactoylglutathione lyase family enzyme
MLRDTEVRAYAPVSDLDKGRQFYEGVLELKVIDAGPGGVMFECANQSHLFMYKTEFAGTSKASCFFWDVTNIEREVAELKERGVTFERYDLPGLKMTSDIFDAGGTKNAWFKDPDGNILALIEPPR